MSTNSYGQFCPIAVASEVVTERWTPLILRELLCGSRRFNDIRRGVPLMSPSLLSKRLRNLERVGVIERDGLDYVLTEAGRELQPVVDAIAAWGVRWAKGLFDPDKLDASLLMWDMQRRIDHGALPDRRVVVHFQLRGSSDKKSHFWMVIDRGTVDTCLTDPGFEVDVVVRGHVRELARYWMGLVEIPELVRSGELKVDGPPRLVRAFPSWFLLSPVARFTRPEPEPARERKPLQDAVVHL